jgi:Fungal potassium channel
MDPLAVQLQSMRWGTGWRRFLVFAELTKSKKKTTWVALFVYFQRKGALRLLLADGPRQFVNAQTLYAVAKAKIIPAGSNAPVKGESGLGQFWENLKALAIADRTQTIILSSMAFTLIIWVISMLFLILALVLYLLFLWHHIQNETLQGFCRRKVETKLSRIVKAKTEKIWAKQEAKREKEERKAIERGQKPAFSASQKQPTLPSLDGSPPKTAEFMLQRNDSIATLPLYTSQPQTPADGIPPPLPRQPTLPYIMGPPRPGPPQRSATGASSYSNASYTSNAPLLREAATPGVSSPPPMDDFHPRPLDRSMTGDTMISQRSFTDSGQQRSYTPGQVSYDRRQGPYGPPLAMPPLARTNTAFSQASTRSSPLSASTNSPLLTRGRSPITPSMSPYDQRIGTPANGPSYEMGNVQQANSNGYSRTPNSDYFSSQSLTSAPLPPGPMRSIGPRRDFSAPMSGPPRGPTPFIPQRSATAPIPEELTRGASTPGPMPRPGDFHRSNTAGPLAGPTGGWR